MGCVYRARHRQLGRDVALKILAPGLEDAQFEERFLREARAMARLDHPGIVRVHDFGRSAGRWYLTMEFVAGTNLRQLMQDGRITARMALALIPQLCDALQYAHDQGVVHRDIKPENILVDGDGRVKVADFGLAKVLGKELEPGLTNADQVMGTLQYMAPEQMHGSRDVDHRADIFSLGVVFYEMLTGQLPIGTFEPPSRRAPVPAGIDAVVSKSLERAPERRYQHAVEVKTDVALAGEVTAPEGEPLPPPWPRRVLVQAGMLGAALLWALAISLFLVTRIHYRDVLFPAGEPRPDHAARAGDRSFYFTIAAVAALAGTALGTAVLPFLRRCGRLARLRLGFEWGLATLVTGASVLVAVGLLGREDALATETGLMAGTLTTLAGVLAAALYGASLAFVHRPGTRLRPDRARTARVGAAVVASALLWLAFWVAAFPLGDPGVCGLACAQAAVVWLAMRRPRETTPWRTLAAHGLCAGFVIGGAWRLVVRHRRLLGRAGLAPLRKQQPRRGVRLRPAAGAQDGRHRARGGDARERERLLAPRTGRHVERSGLVAARHGLLAARGRGAGAGPAAGRVAAGGAAGPRRGRAAAAGGAAGRAPARPSSPARPSASGWNGPPARASHSLGHGSWSSNGRSSGCSP
jgi:hypothetical protein